MIIFLFGKILFKRIGVFVFIVFNVIIGSFLWYEGRMNIFVCLYKVLSLLLDWWFVNKIFLLVCCIREEVYLFWWFVLLIIMSLSLLLEVL